MAADKASLAASTQEANPIHRAATQVKQPTTGTSHSFGNGFAKFAALGGPLSILFFFIMLPMTDFLPPKPPRMPTEKVVAHYVYHEKSLKGGVALMTFVGLFFPLYTAAIGGQLSRIPGMPKTVIYTQLIGGTLGGLFLTLPAYFFAVTMYRLDRPPEITQALHDQAWIFFAMPFPSLLAQDLSFSYGVLLDRRQNPLFPHWLAYFSSGMTLTFWPALGTHCVKHGAVAWNGGLTFWTAGVGGGLQILVMSIYTWFAASRKDLPADGEATERTITQDVEVNRFALAARREARSCPPEI
ncbi:uncharacterized protein A1O5_00792 [Cladophialophora psammophila CBS 110553]|uniref:Integral membrane protein n=1 Tax=Cladophialophora psammophila CBS 110553 TaxID=1182543 RepID=W9Y1C1_9EURO|nr:uncharacterized protein A1O5_00792 [Cladophialophora psammophila CBS 110553]EXJ76284.1 hypothetical protein A1O5_00792 [Cladophialophora psammophila CBS 110553]